MITYTDKVQLTPNPNPDINQWKAVDANEVKTEVNTDITNLSTHVSDTSNPHSVTATQVGLGNVDNTSDAGKPVSTATQTALNLKADITYVDTQDAGKQPLDADLTTIAGLTPSNDDFLQRKSGAWANRTIAQVQADLGVIGAGSVLVTGTDTLDNTDLNKTILCSGTSSDYAVALPTAVGITGQWYDFVGVAGLTKIVTVNANSTETINGLTVDRPFSGRGGFKIVSDGANWQVFAERPSNIPYTPTVTGTSGQPTLAVTYSLLGKMMTIIFLLQPQAASGTGLSFNIPSGYTINTINSVICRVQSNGTLQAGICDLAAAATSLSFTQITGTALSSSGNKSAQGQVTFEIL